MRRIDLADAGFLLAEKRETPMHVGGVNVLMGDGSTRFVAETIRREVWRGLGTRNGRELVE